MSHKKAKQRKKHVNKVKAMTGENTRLHNNLPNVSGKTRAYMKNELLTPSQRVHGTFINDIARSKTDKGHNITHYDNVNKNASLNEYKKARYGVQVKQKAYKVYGKT